MADNYIERQMEALRSGRLAIKNRRPGIRPGSRRVLVAGPCSDTIIDKILAFRKEECRVALFDSDTETGKDLAYRHGIRFHHVDISDPDSLRKETYALLKVWRGIDIIVGSEKDCKNLAAIIRNWKESLPIPDKSEVEFVIVENRD